MMTETSNSECSDDQLSLLNVVIVGVDVIATGEGVDSVELAT